MLLKNAQSTWGAGFITLMLMAVLSISRDATRAGVVLPLVFSCVFIAVFVNIGKVRLLPWMVGVVSLFAFIVMSPLKAFLLGVYPLLLGMWVGEMFRQRRSTDQLILMPIFGVVVFEFLSAIVYQVVHKRSLVEVIINKFVAIYANQAEIAKNIQVIKMPKDFYEQINEVKELLPQAMSLLMPSYLSFVAMLVGFFIYATILFLLKKAGTELSFVRPFHLYRLPKSVILVYLMIFLVQMFTDNARVVIGLVTAQSILSAMIVFVGFAVVDVMFLKMGLNRLLRFLLYFFAIVVLMALSLAVGVFLPIEILLMVGIFDVLFNYRRLPQKGGKDA